MKDTLKEMWAATKDQGKLAIDYVKKINDTDSSKTLTYMVTYGVLGSLVMVVFANGIKPTAYTIRHPFNH